MDQPLISVIVPVYKVEDYLRHCVDSIRAQTYRNLEIILVDDGSPDRCGEMCDEFAREDKRIRVIHKKNGGLSDARNAGLDEMRGEYVAFVDSDDWIEPAMIEVLYRNLEKAQAQISCCGTARYLDGKVDSYLNEKLDEEFVADKLQALRLLTENSKITNSMWDKLYEANIFRDLRMKCGVIYEDMQITAYCLAQADRIAYTAQPLYCYRLSPDSILRGEFSARHFDAYRASVERVRFYQEKYPEVLAHARKGHVRICLNLLFGSWGRDDWDEYRKILVADLKKPIEEEVWQLLSRKEKVKVMLVRIHPKIYCVVAKFFVKRR